MIKNKRAWPVLFLVFLLVPTYMWAAGPEPAKPSHRIPKVTSKFKIDGILNESIWNEALVLNLDYEVEPGENIAPPVKTQVLIAYNEKYLLIGFRAVDPDPSKIRAHVTDRDNIGNDDFVGIALDTFDDSRYAYIFHCNPYGIQADRIEGMSETGDQWDGIWDSAARINKEGYCAEIAIPFSSLRFQRTKEDQVWGIDAIRHYPRNLSHTIGLFPRDRSNNCYMCQAEKLVGFSGAKPGKNMEFVPTFSAGLTQEKPDFPDGKFVKKNSYADPGLTARWSFTPNMTLSAAVNPDFSQVEADAPQLDINNQFALYYPEKRPFFLEGNNIFQDHFYTIYSRTVADPEWGFKLTGKEGKNAIGFFTARDTITNLIIPSSQFSQLTSLPMKNLSTALRYRRDVGKSSTIGIIATNREGGDYVNRTAGFDGILRFTKKDQFLFQLMGSQTRYPDEIVTGFGQPDDKFTGHALFLSYRHITQHVFLFAHYIDISSGFRGDVGFIDQTGYKAYETGGLYTWRRNPGHWFTLFTFGGRYFRLDDASGQNLQHMAQNMIVYNGPLQSNVMLQTAVGKRSFLGYRFDDINVTLNASIRPSGPLQIGINAYFGDQVDVVNIRPGDRLMLNPVIQYNIGKHIYLGVDHVFERLNVEGGRLYTANLSNLRFVYQFNRRTFLRTILQYADYKYNTALYLTPRDPRFKHLFSQILFSYKINPQTVLFLGYSDDYYGYSIIPLKQNNRTFFLKIGYALVL